MREGSQDVETLRKVALAFTVHSEQANGDNALILIGIASLIDSNADILERLERTEAAHSTTAPIVEPRVTRSATDSPTREVPTDV